MRKLTRVAASAVIGLVGALAGEARAEWRIQHGLDIATASDSVLLIGELDERATLYAKCLPKSEMPAELSIHVFDGLSDPLPGPTFAEIAVATDSGGLWSSPGERRRVPGYIVTQWIDGTTIGLVLESFIAARAEIRVTVRTPASEAGWTASATGSTAAGRAFIEACSARLPATLVEPDPAPPVDTMEPQQPRGPARAPIEAGG